VESNHQHIYQPSAHCHTDTADVVDSTADYDDYLSWAPLQTIGSIGDYAVSAVSQQQSNKLGPTKTSDLAPGCLGTDDWKTSWPTVQGTNSVSGALTVGYNMYINGTLVTVGDGGTALTVAGFATAINKCCYSWVYSCCCQQQT
jgi:hypothetical protein